jgi:predicted amidohydrolase
MRRPDLGRLAVGGVGDATLLRVEECRFALEDVDGRVRWTDQRIVAVGTVKAGEYTRLSYADTG